MGIFHGGQFLEPETGLEGRFLNLIDDLNQLKRVREVKMRHLIGIIAATMFLFCTQLYALGADACKIGVVDIAVFQQKSVAFQKIKDEYIKNMEPKRQELETERSELVELEEELRKQSMMLSLDAKEDRRKELAKRSRHYKYLENELVQEIKEAEAVRAIGADIQEIVEKIGKKEGYTMILEKRAVGFLYNNDKIDITDEVIKAYDQMKQ